MTDNIDISKLPAFPVTMTGPCEFAGINIPQRGTVQYGGMTLRDYFAAKAMQGFAAHLDGAIKRGNETGPEANARLAYEYADAMIKARG